MQNTLTSFAGKLGALALAAALTAVVQGGVWHCFAGNVEQVALPSVTLPAVTITAQRAEDATPVAQADTPAPRRQ